MFLKNQSNNLLQTPLSISIAAGALKEVQRLIRDGAANEIFIKGSTNNSIICTLPNARKPQSSVVIHPPPLPSISSEILNIVDEGLMQYLNSQLLSNKDQNNNNNENNQIVIYEGFRIGDLVRLKYNTSHIYDIQKCLGDLSWVRTGIIVNISPHGSDPLQNVIFVQELVYGIESTYLEGELTFADGTLPDSTFNLLPCPNGKSKLFKKNASLTTDLQNNKNNKNTITNKNITDPPINGSILSLSSNDINISPKNNGKDNIIDLNNNTASSCMRTGKSKSPPVITIEIPNSHTGSNNQVNNWFRLELYTYDFQQNNPDTISIFAGDDLSKLTPINTITPTFNGNWFELTSTKMFSSKLKTFPKYVTIELKSKTNDIKISRIRLVTENLPDVTPLCVGDRVVLSDSFSENEGNGWCLGSKSNTEKIIGVVIAALPFDYKSLDQKVLVMAENPNDLCNEYSIFHASWLERAPLYHDFKVGDIVSLNPSTESYIKKYNLTGTSLTTPYACGLIASIGPTRNGIQRNIEVISLTTPNPDIIYQTNAVDSIHNSDDVIIENNEWDGNWERLCGSDYHRSFYPSSVLIPSVRSLSLLQNDKHIITEILSTSLQHLSPSIDFQVLVNRLGHEVWSRICLLYGIETVLSIFRNWMKITESHPYPKINNQSLINSEELIEFLNSKQKKNINPFTIVDDNNKIQNIDNKLWACTTCGYSNNSRNLSKCSACNVRGPSWTCKTCQTRNKVNVLKCTKCKLSLNDTSNNDNIETTKTEVIDTTGTKLILSANNTTLSEKSIQLQNLLDTDIKCWEVNGFPAYIEVRLPPNTSLHTLSIYLGQNGAHDPSLVDISYIDPRSKYMKMKQKCLNSLCSYLPQGIDKDYCCKNCQEGNILHSPDCTSSCNDLCWNNHNRELCRICQTSFSGHFNHLCPGTNTRGKFASSTSKKGNSIIEYVSTIESTSIKMIKAFNLPRQSNPLWYDLLTPTETKNIEVGIILITFHSSFSGSIIRVSSLNITTRKSNTQLSWTCISCMNSNFYSKPNCSLCFSKKHNINDDELKELHANQPELQLPIQQKLSRMIITELILKSHQKSYRLQVNNNINTFQKSWNVNFDGLTDASIKWVDINENIIFFLHFDVHEEVLVLSTSISENCGEKQLPFITKKPFQCNIIATNEGFILSSPTLYYFYQIPTSFSFDLERRCIGNISCIPEISQNNESNITNSDKKIENEEDLDDDDNDDDDNDNNNNNNNEIIVMESNEDIELNNKFSTIQDIGIMPSDISPPQLNLDGHQTSIAFWSRDHFDKIESIHDLCTWKDKDGSNAAHHAAFCKLYKSLNALWSLGINKWATNKHGESSIGLALGVRGSERDFLLFKACYRRQLLDPDYIQQFGQCPPLISAALRCPENYNVSNEIKNILLQIINGQAEEALDILIKMVEEFESNEESDDFKKIIHISIYKSLAMLYAGYGRKACLFELDRYIQDIKDSDDSFLDPIYFFVIYILWKHHSLNEKSKIERLKAADALSALKTFSLISSIVLTSEDNLDEIVYEEERLTEKFNFYENSDDDDEDDDDEINEELSPDSPEYEWKMAKAQHNAISPSMDKLMNLTGLKAVKTRAMGVFKEALLRPLRPEGLEPQTTMNFLFVGNPGSGKTTVAELLSASMAEIGYRSNPTPVITNAGDILKSSDPPTEFENMVNNAKGGTLFIDEAYLFKPAPRGSTANASNNVLDYLLKVSEDLRDTTTFILAGYKDDILNLLNYNEGFRSRFPKEFTFEFEDYNEIQLKKIFQSMVKSRGFRLQSKRECGVSIATVIGRRIARGSGKKGFGNAREVRNRLDSIISVHTDRIGSIVLKGGIITEYDHRTILKTDALGDRPNLQSSPMLKELDSMIGLSKVKMAVHGLMELQLQNYDREMRGDAPELISLHRVFYGNPGTGKTTVARIYGALLKEFRYLSDGDLVQVTGSDLIGDHVGAASTKTAEIIEKAKGKVLFIDEAYVLDPTRRSNSFGGSVLDTIVEKIEGAAGSDMAVIFAGYEDEMNAMFRNSGNAGLSRRFNLSEALRFEDFSDNELLTILKRMVNKCGLIIDPGTAKEVIRIVAQGRRLDGFGNAGAVETILGRAKINKSSRITAALAARHKAQQERKPLPPLPNPDYLILQDFITEENSSDKARDLFKDMVNIEHILGIINSLEATIIQAKNDGKSASDILANSHMIFTGPPGTGKTTVAKHFGNVMKNLELLPKNDVVCVTGQSLQGAYIGSTGPLVTEVMKKAKGGILFIDEAYGLIPKRGNYGEEAIQTLLDNMTRDEFKGNLLIIIAGYENNIEELFTVNPGLRSRLDKCRIAFPKWTGQQATTATVNAISRDNKTITESGSKKLLEYYNILENLSDWGSAREVYEVVLPALYMTRAQRLVNDSKLNPPSNSQNNNNNNPPPYTETDVISVLEPIVLQRKKLVKKKSNLNNFLQSNRNNLDSDEYKYFENEDSMNLEKINEEVKYLERDPDSEDENNSSDESDDDSDDFLVSLEEACSELNYTPYQMNNILTTKQFPDELINLLVGKTGKTSTKIRRMLIPQCGPLLTRIQLVIKQIEETKSKEEQKRQEKILKLGKCPMSYEWLKVEGGYRCAGGSHYCTDSEIDAYCLNE